LSSVAAFAAMTVGGMALLLLDPLALAGSWRVLR
jgi:hypothetical protein